MCNGKKTEEIERDGELLSELEPVQGAAPESAEQEIDDIGCDAVEHWMLADFPETPDDDKYSQNEHHSGVESIGLTVIVENKIAAQEYSVGRQQQEGEYSL